MPVSRGVWATGSLVVWGEGEVGGEGAFSVHKVRPVFSFSHWQWEMLCLPGPVKCPARVQRLAKMLGS